MTRKKETHHLHYNTTETFGCESDYDKDVSQKQINEFVLHDFRELSFANFDIFTRSKNEDGCRNFPAKMRNVHTCSLLLTLYR